MTHHLATQFILADGSRARWVKRSEGGEDFVTVREVAADAPAERRHGPGGTVQSPTGRAFDVGHSDDAAKHRGVFAAQLAEQINHDVQNNRAARMVIVAPARMLGEIKSHLTDIGRATLAGTLARDLTKIPDHELKTWLEPLEMARLPGDASAA